MTLLKKYAWYGSAVVASLALALVMLVSSTPRTVQAATLTTAGNGTATTAAAGTAGTIVLTLAAGDMQNTQTLIVTAPSSFAFVGAPTSVLSGPATTLTGVGTAVLSQTVVANDTATFTATANNNAAAVMTISYNIRYAGGAGNRTGVGNIAISGTGVAAIANAGSVVATFVSPATTTVATATGQTSIAADGSAAVGLTSTMTDASGVLVPNVPVNWSSSIGIIGTGTSKTGLSSTGTGANAGIATQSTYRCTSGSAATDTVIVSYSTLSTVGTLSINCTTSSGTTAAKIAFNAPTQAAVAATVTNKSPNYQSPQTGTNISLKVSDASGLGVNGQVVLVTVSKGFIQNGFGQACPGTTKAVSPTTASAAPSVGATVEAGIIQLTFCGNQDDAPGAATLTAQNVSTTMANATATISMAGRPNKVTATVTGTAISAKVTDADGNAVADGTPVRFTISANAGAVSTACTTSSNGAASSVVALIGSSGTVIVSTDWNETGAAATCAAAGTQQAATSVVVGAGGGSTPAPAPSTGAGGFASAPVFSAAKLANVVYTGSVADLDKALVAAGATGAWAQDSKGVFMLYVVNGGFVNDGFKAAFPNGFTTATALTIVGK